MLISYKWLQSYFDEKLPPPEKLAERISFGFAEVEAIKSLETSDFADRRRLKTQINADRDRDTILDIKVLPDRACYTLSHRGVAYEVAAVIGKSPVDIRCPQRLRTSDIHRQVNKVRTLSVCVEAPELCPRYMARVIENITPREMPWVKEHLEAVSQRTIHPVVDGANIVMFDMGQPLHAFDADKVEGGIIVRRARKGEKITTLDNKEVALDESVLIIADEKSPLALAGIKGGTKAAVTSDTKNLILEAASFNPSYIRKTAERLGIKTDASKRFENKLSPEMAAVGMSDFTAFLFESDKNIKAGEIIDWYPAPQKERKIVVSPEYITRKLGMPLAAEQIEEVLSRLLIKIEKKKDVLILTPPVFRMDLNIPEDIAEEVGRLVGYDKIPSALPPKAKEPVHIPKEFYYEWKIREILVSAGFSEIMTSSFGATGEVVIEKPLAEDKKYARPNLLINFEKALKVSIAHAPLFGIDSIKIFELGKVFLEAGEHTALILGLKHLKKQERNESHSLTSIIQALEKDLGGRINSRDKASKDYGAVFEINLDDVIKNLPEPKKWDISISASQSEKKFTPFSLYPFIVRDVALFVPPDLKPVAVAGVIKKNAGNLVVRGPELFDEFSRDGKKSLAFRLVFQSFDRTLSDEEVNKQMEEIYTALKAQGWEVR